MFKPLQREETLASRVTTQVENLIVQNELHPGDRLPGERDLAAQFGVSRTVVREAVRALTAKGMLEVRHGSGTIVRTPTAESIAQSMALYLRGDDGVADFKDVVEVRRLLEIEIAGLAAERRTEQDLQKLSILLEDNSDIRTNQERFVSWDIAFHAALAEATQNALFPLLLHSVVGAMRRVRELGFQVKSTPANAMKHHSAILREVKLGSRERARKAMANHLDEAEETLRKALEAAAKAGR